MSSGRLVTKENPFRVSQLHFVRSNVSRLLLSFATITITNFHMLSLHESHIWPDLSELELYKLEITNLVLVTFPWIWRKASCWFWDKMIIGLHISYSTSSKTMSFWNQLSKNKLNSNFVEKYFFHHPSLSRNHRSKYLLYDIRPVHCD